MNIIARKKWNNRVARFQTMGTKIRRYTRCVSSRVVHVAAASGALFLLWPGLAPAQTALEHLRAAQPPVFKPGHTLIPLSRWGWSVPYEVTVELCERIEQGRYS